MNNQKFKLVTHLLLILRVQSLYFRPGRSLEPATASNDPPPAISNKQSSLSAGNHVPPKKVVQRPLKKPDVKVQPWLSSSVWDHGPTIPLKYHNLGKYTSRSSTKNRVRTRSSERNKSSSLGGTRQQGSVLSTVRNVWAPSAPADGTSALPPKESPTPADEVRSSWLSRFPQSKPKQNQIDLN